ncbi:CDP-glucose 4,6-dehydratase [Paenibacillus selenitireducens]|uniref:CDP-glucose 4,6-dehydratase n=1 Tax=Paenibacillus selenitireducens TaxID=1324314 RepID=A0A1T2XLC2_9BACL|nr:CDP-glucose 4,6-dehydratase [Paenibacillus selenitireducens]OPA80622.1 CDP-glucose 4,6-dehydratase [Paenibacillus selenitireducens]
MFWNHKNVFITGHTGFKGSWLSLWLHQLGAHVTGYALRPPTEPNLFDLCHIDHFIHSIYADIRDRDHLQKAIEQANPDIIIHMAAQPLVRESYQHPVETYEINVMGTVHLFEAVRTLIRNQKSRVKVIINVTTDKCYENQEWSWGYRENDPLGGYDPYSNSKACSELVTASYRHSFFNPKHVQDHGVSLISARSGNVIGGGDWATDRLIPDCIRSLLNHEPIKIRNPLAVRPWQHVLEPLAGYLQLAQQAYGNGPKFAQSWNFGPLDHDTKPVEWIVQYLCTHWGSHAAYEAQNEAGPHEAKFLKLDCSRAKTELGWVPRWNLETALDKILEWTHAYQENQDVKEICLKQIADFQ